MSNGDQALDFIYLLLLLILVGSGLAVRRIPIAHGLRMLLAWLLIFAGVFLAFTLKDDFLALGKRAVQEVSGENGAVQEGETLRIRMAGDGHFWVDGRINGQEVRFLVDSGATTTSLSTETARRAGIKPGGGLPAVVQTANGTVSVQRAEAARIQVGGIERRDMAVHISDGFGDTNVLGMNFLSSLSGWGVEGNWLILRP